jgi:transposase
MFVPTSLCPPVPAAPPKFFVGLDTHKDTIVAAVLGADAATPEPAITLPTTGPALARFVQRLLARGPAVACYEASGGGYVLQRQLTAWGLPCVVVAPGLVPVRPGHQRKHDRADAAQLALQYRAGALTPVRVPTPADERVRDLVRCRQQLQRALLRARHQLRTFLVRRGFVYRRVAWTQAHGDWLSQVLRTLPPQDYLVASEYRAHAEYLQARRTELDRLLAAVAATPALAPAVQRLQCFRGLDVLAALGLHVELVDWQRFTTPTQLMAFWGLVPREASSGATARRGGLTKAGSAWCRHLLVQAAWSYRHPPRVRPALLARQAGQPAAVVAHAWKAQQRLHALYRRLRQRRGAQIAVVAVARELVGFLWAVMQDVPAPAHGVA